jgi:maleylpyruvate isomerase
MTSDLDRDLAGARMAQEALVDSLGGVTDEDARRASLLPGWTVGHVLTHLARNAESHTRMLVAARLGQVGEQYPGGLAQRAADIEAGADRPATALIADVVNSAIEVADAWAAMTPEAWTGTGRMPEQDIAVADLPFRRWREVEVHRADLGLGFGWEDWSDQYVEAELSRTLPTTAGRTADGRPVELPADLDRRRALAWLLGRTEAPPGMPSLTPWQATSSR